MQELNYKNCFLEEDALWLREQRNRPEIMKYFRQSWPLSIKQQMVWYSKIQSPDHFIIKLNKDNIGYVGLNHVNYYHGSAEFSIFIIPEYQGNKYGENAVKFILVYGFKNLCLNKIYSDVLDYPNEERFKFYENLGFTKEGILRKQYFKNNQWIDSIQFSMLKEEWDKLNYEKRNTCELETPFVR